MNYSEVNKRNYKRLYLLYFLKINSYIEMLKG